MTSSAGGQVTTARRLNMHTRRSKQAHLCPFGRHEQIGPERKLRLSKAEPMRSRFEPLADQIGPRTLAAHPAEEVRIIVAAAAKRADGRHDLARTVREMFVEPGPEQGCDL